MRPSIQLQKTFFVATRKFDFLVLEETASFFFFFFSSLPPRGFSMWFLLDELPSTLTFSSFDVLEQTKTRAIAAREN